MFRMITPRRKLSRRTSGQRLLALVLLAASLAIVSVAERDIQRRPAEQVRGRKPLWRLVSLNALGALAYLRWGRARA